MLNLRLITERLLINPLVADDKLFFCSIYSNSKIMKYISEPLSEYESECLFRKAISESYADSVFWKITLNSGSDIGLFGLQRNKGSIASWDLGTLIKPEFHSLGYASEAMKALINFLFESCSVEEITGTIPHGNVPCENLVKHLGYSKSHLCKKYSHWKVTDLV